MHLINAWYWTLTMSKNVYAFSFMQTHGSVFCYRDAVHWNQLNLFSFFRWPLANETFLPLLFSSKTRSPFSIILICWILIKCVKQTLLSQRQCSCPFCPLANPLKNAPINLKTNVKYYSNNNIFVFIWFLFRIMKFFLIYDHQQEICSAQFIKIYFISNGNIHSYTVLDEMNFYFDADW